MLCRLGELKGGRQEEPIEPLNFTNEETKAKETGAGGRV